MDYFGDESGHLKGLLQGDCEVCVIAVVGGDRVACGSCPKKTVRRVDDISEARWYDLFDVQKRRLFECFAENDHLQFGYSIFRKRQLESLRKSHLLFQDVDLPPPWDLALAGYAYGEILFEMGAREENLATFTFDRISSQKQSEKVADHVSAFVDVDNIFYEGSRQVAGIQAADCLAGAVAEDIRKGTEYMDRLDDDAVYECTPTSIAQLEHDLHEYDTGP